MAKSSKSKVSVAVQDAAQAVSAAAQEAAKHSLSAEIQQGFKLLGAEIGAEERKSRGRWMKFRPLFAELTRDFPRLQDGEIDEKSDEYHEARDLFMSEALLALVDGAEYDRALHRVSDYEVYIPCDKRPANYTLTGRACMLMDKDTLKALPSLVDHPLGMRRFVEATRGTVNNTATAAWRRFFKSEFTDKIGGRGATTDIEEWLDGLAKPMLAKLSRARKEGRRVTTNEQAKAALAAFRKALVG